MKSGDVLLQRWRLSKVLPYLKEKPRVLDVGCSDGILFKRFHTEIGMGVGIDPHLTQSVEGSNYLLIPGAFPQSLQGQEPFDVITMFAVFEHVPEQETEKWANHCQSLLKPGGHLVITVPSLLADPLLDVLKALKIIDGMDLDQHHGLSPSSVPDIFMKSGLDLIRKEKFQLGLNNLFVFRKPLLLHLARPVRTILG